MGEGGQLEEGYTSINTDLKHFSHCGSFLLESSYIKFTA